MKHLSIGLVSISLLVWIASSWAADGQKEDEIKFYPIPGGQPGIMDQATKDFLESKASDPTQKSLDAMLAEIDTITVETTMGKQLFSTNDKAKVDAFKQTMQIVEDPKTFGHCMCFGDPQIFLKSGSRKVAHLSCQHGFGIRWNDGWKWDANLKDGNQLTEWLAVNGAPELKNEVDDDRKRAEEGQKAIKKWLAAMPKCFGPYVQDVMGESGFSVFTAAGGKQEHAKTSSKYAKFWDALNKAYPDEESGILALLHWYGSGAGEWSGYGAYEMFPQQMLDDVGPEKVSNVVQHHTLSDIQLEGAARYIANYHCSIPADVQETLMAHVTKVGDKDKIERLKTSFSKAKKP